MHSSLFLSLVHRTGLLSVVLGRYLSLDIAVIESLLWRSTERTTSPFVVSGDMRGIIKNSAGIAVDREGNSYVGSRNKLHKFTANRKLLKCVQGEFDDPHGMAIYQNRLYVSDRKNNRIQVFELDTIFQVLVCVSGRKW